MTNSSVVSLQYWFIPLSHLCGSSCAENRRKPQIYRRWTARFRDFPHVLAEKLNMF